MNSILYNGITIMLIGMGTVLLFLCIMIFAMLIMSKVIIYLNKIFPEFKEEIKIKKVVSNIDETIAAAIASAYVKNKQ